MTQYQHANLVRLLDFIHEKKNLYFILEYKYLSPLLLTAKIHATRFIVQNVSAGWDVS